MFAMQTRWAACRDLTRMVAALGLCWWLVAPVRAVQPANPPPIPNAQRPLFDRLHVPDAWRVSRGADCGLGFIDVGFDFFHPALKTALAPAFHADGVYHSDASTVVAHGTAVASVVIARPTDGSMVGLAPECMAMGAAQGMPEHTLAILQQALARDGKTDADAVRQALVAKADEIRAFSARWLTHITTSTADAIRSLADGGARVINISEYLSMSLIGKDPAAAARIEAAFAYAASKDVLVVLGAGNNDERVEAYPGAGLPVIVVGASTLDDKRWVMAGQVNGRTVRQGSNTGPRLSVLAPAEDIVVAEPHDPAFYGFLQSPMGASTGTFNAAYRVMPSGATSLASAVVAGLASLARAVRPDLSASDIRRAIELGARDIGDAGRDDDSGHGVVDFGRTLALLAEKTQ